MREIKFRAWLKKENKMVEVKSIHLGTKKIIHGYSENSQCYGNKSCSFDDIELMQYTGLKDKNGKEIYKGDIVKFNNQIGEICFECGAFGIGVKDCVDYETLEAYRGERFYGCLNDNFISLWEIYWNFNCVDYEIDEIEVIGNIYENPELLEVE